MFERFTEQARQVVVLAQEEARMLQHNYIGTEHLLLGVLREQDGLGASVLESHGASIARARELVVAIVGPGEEDTSGQIPFTPRAKHVLQLALDETLRLGHNYIGTEHLLLGILAEREGVAVGMLSGLGIDLEGVRHELVRGAPAGQLTAQLPLSDPAREVLNRAMELARNQGEAQVSLDHLREALGREGETGT